MLVKEMWDAYIATNPQYKEARYDCWHFCSDEKSANQLLKLVLVGRKRATASSLWIYEHENAAIPKVDDFSIVTDWDGNPGCIIRNTKVKIAAFKDISEEDAITEGEGDLSLSYWREVHRECFEIDCKNIVKTFDESMPVVFEEFTVVYRP